MLRISRAVEYGLIAVDYLSSRGGLVTSRELSEDLKLPPGIIAKTLQRLATAGFVRSEQGPRGGYKLARDPSEISFLDLSRAIDNHQHIAPCSDEADCERKSSCTVAGPVAELDSQINGLLSGISLAQLLATRTPEEARQDAQ